MLGKLFYSSWGDYGMWNCKLPSFLFLYFLLRKEWGIISMYNTDWVTMQVSKILFYSILVHRFFTARYGCFALMVIPNLVPQFFFFLFYLILPSWYHIFMSKFLLFTFIICTFLVFFFFLIFFIQILSTENHSLLYNTYFCL